MKNEKIDKSHMRQVILDFPKQFEKGIEAAKDIKISGKFENIIVAAMGGSAWPADIIDTYCISGLPIYITRDYQLHEYTTKNSLVFVVSYSGNTEEVISCYQEAVKRKLKIVVIASGGKLEKLAKRDGTAITLIPEKNIEPRSAAGYIFSMLFTVLSNTNIIKQNLEELLDVAKNLEGRLLDLEKQGKDLAKRLKGYTPIVYTSNRFKGMHYIWKIKFNENSKILAFCNHFPELNHNEMNGYENLLGKFAAIILKDKEDNPLIKKRMTITADLLKDKGAEVITLDLVGENILTKIFSSLLLADWASYYLALEYGVDPTPVKMVEDFKRRMAE